MAASACGDGGRETGAGDGVGRIGLAREGSVASGGTVSFGEPARAYRITYRVRAAAGDGVTESVEEITAARPFDSRVEVRADGDVVARRAGRFGALVVAGDGGTRVLAVPPAPGASDVRPDAALADAVDLGLAERREVREVAARRCRVYRLGSTASDGTLVPIGTDPGDYADLCVDERGLVLEEWWVDDGKPLRQRLAIDVDDGITVADAVFRLAGEQPPGPTDGSLDEIDLAAGEEVAEPAGFRWRGRFAVTPAQVAQPTGGDMVPPRTVIADVWERGADLLVLERGPGTVAPSPYGIPTEVAGVGVGELIVDLRASEVRLTTAGGDTVRLYGTVSPSGLVELARDLLSLT